MENYPTITFDKKNFNRLKMEYKKAVRDNKQEFLFLSNPILTAYAKYLLEYLSTKFK